MDRPPFAKPAPTYFTGVRVALEECANRLDEKPEDLEVAFGNTGEPAGGTGRPNYQVNCAERSFVFSGANHHPFRGQSPSGHLKDAIDGCFREGTFNPSNLYPACSYDAISKFAAEDMPEDDPGDFEERLRKSLGSLKLSPQDAGTTNPEGAERRLVLKRQAQRDASFARRLLHKQGEPNHCAVCDEAVRECLQGAHVLDVQHGGRDTVENGIVLCASHHLLFDKHLFGIEPEQRTVVVSGKYTREQMRITCDKVDEPVGKEALKHRWDYFKAQA